MTHPLRLLLIDDDELDRLSITRILNQQTSMVVEVCEARTGDVGLTLIQEQQFDAILLDFRLPDQSGLDVLRKLRADGVRRTAIIMLSNQEDDALAEQCIEAGAQDFLQKAEVSGRRLTRAIRHAQQRYAMEETLRCSHEKLRDLAEHDGLTGLVNRYGLEVALQLAVARAQRHKTKLAILFLDLDKFKEVNDTLGHHVGDDLLKIVAQRLSSVVRDSDLVARLGGDEFVVLVPDMVRDDQINLLAERALKTLQLPMFIGTSELVMSASIGVAVLGSCAENSTDLMKYADIAMYQAKQEGRNQIRFYSDGIHQAVQARANIEYDLRQALEQGQLRVYYQAQMTADSGVVKGIEALLRWEHPERGLLLPEEFLVTAEEMGLIVPIGDWVLRTACLQLSQWQKRSETADLRLVIAVNLSAIQIRGDRLLQSVDDALSQSQLPSSCLELEITENALIDDTGHTMYILNRLVARGVALSLGDFGIGYSTLQHLKQLSIQALKIDQEFVSAIGQGVQNDRLLSAMICFAQTLKLTVIAEGVETREQADFCREHGCDLLQGFYYSKPVPAEEFEAQFLK